MQINNDNFLTSKHFCLKPWLHKHNTVRGETWLCCNAPKKIGPVEQADEATLGQIKELLLDDQKIDACEACYQRERLGGVSMRNDFNLKYKELFEQKEDGLVSFDVRFSNECNCKCRYCAPAGSSLIAEEYKKFSIKAFNPLFEVAQVNSQETQERLFNLIARNVSSLKEINFAGGEPLVMEMHYRVLDLLLQHGRTDVELLYTTNFSTLEFNSKSVLDYWSKFKSVHIVASADHHTVRNDYIRSGSSIEKFIQNKKDLSLACPHVSFSLLPLVSIYNILTLKEFFQTFSSIGFNGWSFSMLNAPSYLNVNLLPSSLRLSLINELTEFQNGLTDRRIIGQWNFIIETLRVAADATTEAKREFVEVTNKLDSIRGTSFVDTFPELKFLMEGN